MFVYDVNNVSEMLVTQPITMNIMVAEKKLTEEKREKKWNWKEVTTWEMKEHQTSKNHECLMKYFSFICSAAAI